MIAMTEQMAEKILVGMAVGACIGSFVYGLARVLWTTRRRG